MAGSAEAQVMKRKADFRDLVKSLLGKYASGDPLTDLYVLRELLAGKDEATLRKVGDAAVAAGYSAEKNKAFGKPGSVSVLGGDDRKAAITAFDNALKADAAALNDPEQPGDYEGLYASTLGTLGLDVSMVWEDRFETRTGIGATEERGVSVVMPQPPEGWNPDGTPAVPDEPLVTAPAGGNGNPNGADSTENAARNDPRYGQDPTPATGGGGSGGDGTGGGGGTGGGTDDTLPADGTPRQIPGGAKLWRVDGRDIYLAYNIPGTNTPLLWRIENPDRLKAIFGNTIPDYDRELTGAELKKLSPWSMGGLSAELINTDTDPWQQFMSDFEKAAEMRPWLKDESVMAVVAVAYLEGREPTSDELATTDWWNEHTADERAWMEASVTAGEKEVQRRKNDAMRAVRDKLTELGVNNPPQSVIEYVAMQRITGRWSQDYTEEQVKKLADPYGPGTLDRGLLAALRDPEQGSASDAAAISKGRDAVKERIRAIFANAKVGLASDTEDEETRLNRIADEIVNGGRTFSDLRRSVDIIAAREGGAPGGLDQTRQGEDRVDALAREWLGPVAGALPETVIRDWAGRIRNDPDAEQEFVKYLQDRRLVLFPNYTNPNLTYEAIVSPVRNLATNIWGQPMDDDALLVDLANTKDYSEMAKRLRREGLARGIKKTTQDAMLGLGSTSLGDTVIRSAI